MENEVVHHIYKPDAPCMEYCIGKYSSPMDHMGKLHLQNSI